MSSLIHLAVFCVLILFNLKVDEWMIRTGKTIDHVFNAICRYIILGANSWAAQGFSQDLELAAFQWLIFQLAVYWLLFDAFLNYLRDLPITYIGVTALLDRIFPSFWLQLLTKLALIGGSLTWIILTD